MRKVCAGIAIWFGLVAMPAWGQGGNLPWQEYERLVEKGRSIAPLDVDSMFGDSVDLYSGALSFSATDVSLPGNDSLPVAVGRKLSIYNRQNYLPRTGYAFGDWDIDIPNLNGVFSTTWHDDRCTRAVPPTVQMRALASDYWAGNHADMPGGGEMLQADVVRPKPSAGGPYLWLTKGDVYFSCLGSIKNGTGQGFLAITKDGVKYWFDQMAQYVEPGYIDVLMNGLPPRVNIPRRKNLLYATRIEDRFGNWVAYAYGNAYNAGVRLSSITSSDGRSLTLQYNANGNVSSVSDGARTWTYQYSSGRLSAIILPDGSGWQFNLAALANAWFESSTEEGRRCFSFPSTLPFADTSGSITHPSGAMGTFTVTLRRMGRTNVPGFCKNYQPAGVPNNDPTDDYPVFPHVWPSLVVKSKQVSGPGIETATWNYDFISSRSYILPPDGVPICRTEDCAEPTCVSDACAGTRTVTITGPGGEWQRYIFGNSYRYNEGKLLTHEQGSGPQNVLKTTVNIYNYAANGQPYAARIGASPQPRGEGFVEEYPRPLVKSETLQDGGLFSWEVAKGCTATEVYCLDALTRPTKVVKTGMVTGVTPGAELVVPPTQVPTLSVPATNNTGSYTVSWTSSLRATSYELQERLGAGNWGAIQNSGAVSRLVEGKAAGSWSYQVRGCNSAGCTGWSTVKTTLVTLPPTDAPMLTAPATNTTGSYTVSWTPVTATNRYELEQRKDAGAWSLIHNAATTSKALNGQLAGAYEYQVRACNEGGCSDWSTVAATTVTLSLGAPALSVSPTLATQGDTLTAGWSSVSGATQYTLERSRNGGVFSTVYNGSATGASFTTGLQGTWKYRVKACNANGCGAFSAEKEVFVGSAGTNLVAPSPEGEDEQ